MALPDFSPLLPQDVADAAEAVLGEPVEGELTAYPSYINRVYGLRAESGRRVVAKFYRPGRWTEAAIREEHGLVRECAEAGLAVLAPLSDAEGETLHTIAVENEEGERSFFFELCPYLGGRGWEPAGAERWLELGRLVAALHRVGARKPAPNRTRLGPETSGRAALARLLAEHVVHPDMRAEFEEVCSGTLDRIRGPFGDAGALRVHGDLHRGNLLEGDGPLSPPVLIDFDDAAVGPAVQDLWLFLPGRLADSREELSLLLEGYEEVRPFDRSETPLIEPLRFLRMLGYLDWQAVQRADAGFPRAFPDWGGRAFWIKELEDLRDQARVIEEGAASTGLP